MASRVSFTQIRLEAELERHRAECQWDKMPAIIEQMQAARFHEDGEWRAPGVEASPAASCLRFYPALVCTLQEVTTGKKVTGFLFQVESRMS